MLQQLGYLKIPLIIRHFLASRVDATKLLEKLTTFKWLDMAQLDLYLGSLTMDELAFMSVVFDKDIPIYYQQNQAEVTPFKIMADIYETMPIRCLIDLEQLLSVEETKSKQIDPRKLSAPFKQAKEILSNLSGKITFIIAKLTVWTKIIDKALSVGETLNYQETAARVLLIKSNRDSMFSRFSNIDICSSELNPVNENPENSMIYAAIRSDINQILSAYRTEDMRSIVTMYKINANSTKFIIKLLPNVTNVIGVTKIKSGERNKITEAKITDIGVPLMDITTNDLNSEIKEKFATLYTSDKGICPLDSNNILTVCGICDQGTVGSVYTDWKLVIRDSKIAFNFTINYPIDTVLDAGEYINTYLWSRCSQDIKKFTCAELPLETGSTFSVVDESLNNKDLDTVSIPSLAISLLMCKIDGGFAKLTGEVSISILINHFITDFIKTSGIERLNIPVNWFFRKSGDSISFLSLALDTITAVSKSDLDVNRKSFNMQLMHTVCKLIGCKVPDIKELALAIAVLTDNQKNFEKIKGLLK